MKTKMHISAVSFEPRFRARFSLVWLIALACAAFNCLSFHPQARAGNLTITQTMLDSLNSTVDFSQSTIAGVPNTLGPGDTVYLSSGTRDRIVLKNLTQGSSANQITITNSGGQFILSGTGANSKGIELAGCRNVILSGTPVGSNPGIKVDSTTAGIVGVNVYESNGVAPTNLEITGLEISHTGFAGIMVKCKNNPGLPIDGITISNNSIHHTTGEAMYIGSTRDTHAGHSKLSNVNISGNTLSAIGLDGIQVHFVTSGLTVANNTIIGYAVTSNTTTPNGEPAEWHNKAIYIGESECVIHSNWIETTTNWSGQAIFLHPYKNSLIYNNVLVHSHDSDPTVSGSAAPAIALYTNGAATYAPVAGSYVKMLNNTMVTPEGPGILDNITSTSYHINNLIAGPRNGAFTSGTLNNASNNLDAATVADAKFVNPGDGDYTLQSDSPAVNAGQNVSGHSVTTDYNGTARPQGSAYDIGAFERTATAPQVSAPTFSPAPGTYSTGQIVSLSSTTSGATIRYTTNGTNPTPTTGTVYSSPISVASTTTLKAIAYKAGLTDSSISSGTYTISTTNPTTVSFQDGIGGYSGTRDTYIRSDATTNNYGAATEVVSDGQPDWAILLKWDLSSIPTTATVVSVTLTFQVSNSSNSDVYFFYAMKRPWNETQATWLNYASGAAWQTAGANGTNDRETTSLASLGGASGVRSVALNATGVAKVQSWINSPSTNLGFALLNYSAPGDNLGFVSKEGATVAQRPKITITYQ